MRVNANKVPYEQPHYIGFGERACAEITCGKVFLLTGPPRQYLYKIEINATNTRYFCCYSHYKKAKDDRDKEKEANKAAYVKRRHKTR